MDQAAVLPDPLDESAVSTTASADDLLAQLAGEEIDRLLAESEAEAAPLALRRRTQDASTGEPATRTTPSAPAVEEDPPEVNLDALAREVDASGEVGSSAAAAPEAAPKAPDIAVPTTRAVIETTPASTAVAPPPQPARVPVTPPPPVDTATLDDVLVASILPAEGAGRRDESDSLPLYLKPLEWLNAPLDALPESWRDALGKVAILTLVNAIAVLLYVALFRH